MPETPLPLLVILLLTLTRESTPVGAHNHTFPGGKSLLERRDTSGGFGPCVVIWKYIPPEASVVDFGITSFSVRTFSFYSRPERRTFPQEQKSLVIKLGMVSFGETSHSIMFTQTIIEYIVIILLGFFMIYLQIKTMGWESIY